MSKLKYTKDLLSPIVKESSSYSEVLRKLGVNHTGGTATNIRNRIRSLKLDISHFKRVWNKGLTKENSLVVARISHRIEKTSDEVFQENCTRNRSTLKRELLKCGVSYICNFCKMLPVWNDTPLTLQIDHINGDNMDNRRENLRFLCPNCHSQTKTFSGRKGKCG
jgi:hypothetical protein